MASEQPDRLAELSRRLTEAGIENRVDWCLPMVQADDGQDSVVFDETGQWTLYLTKTFVHRLRGPIARAIVVAAGVFADETV